MGNSFAAFGAVFTVLAQARVASEPDADAFDYPAVRQNLEALFARRSVYPIKSEPEPSARPLEQISVLVDAVKTVSVSWSNIGLATWQSWMPEA
jgi:hypothetical protein